MKDLTESCYNRMNDVIDIIKLLRKEEQFKDVDLNERLIDRVRTNFYIGDYYVIEEKGMLLGELVTRDIIVKDLEGNYLFRETYGYCDEE